MTTIPESWLLGPRMFDLSGQTALVTGGSRGLGTAMATALASCGAKVMITSRKSADAERVAETISKATGQLAYGSELEIGNIDSIPAFVENVVQGMETVDILVNNAGINIRGPIEALSIEEFRKVCDVNVIGLRYLTKHVVPIADTEDAKRNVLGATALERWGRLEEIQSAVVYLASRSSSYCTGSLLAVDGGWTAK